MQSPPQTCLVNNASSLYYQVATRASRGCPLNNEFFVGSSFIGQPLGTLPTLSGYVGFCE